MLVVVGLCAWTTELIGVHVIFGAFVVGAIWPRSASQEFVAEVHHRLEPATMVLLPVFFVLPGLSIDLSKFDAGDVRTLGVVLLVATAGKFLSTLAAARSQRIDWRPATALATLMNTRGVMELVVLNIGFTAGVIDLRLYSIFVIMAIVTTVATGPLLDLIYPSSRRDGAASRRFFPGVRAMPGTPERAEASPRATR